MVTTQPRNTIYTRINRDGTPDASGDRILFGAYPQSCVKEEPLISQLNHQAGTLPTHNTPHSWTSCKYYIADENETDFMWYQDICHGGTKYRGVYFTAYRPNDTSHTCEENCQAANGYHPGIVYWFVYEPIKWQILNEQNGKAWLITDTCIDSQAYRTVLWHNSYVKSSVRAWLNDSFLKTAFCDRERGAVSRERITNNMEDEDVCDGGIPGSDTYDLVHLLSQEEVAERIPQGQRQSTSTDYAHCQGICVHPENGYSVWWLRSPYYSVEAWAQIVGTLSFFDFSSGEVGNTDTGIRPALWLNL